MTTQSDRSTLTESPGPKRGAADKVSTRTAARLARSLWGLSLALTALSLLLLGLNLSHPNVHISEQVVEDTLIAVVCSTVGAVIASRRPENPIGWIFCTIGFVGGVERFGAEYATYTLLVAPGSLSGGEALAWSMSWLWIPHVGLYVFLGLLFPNGRLPSSRWRGVAWLNVVVVLIGAILVAFSPGSSRGLDPIRDPLEVENSVASLVEVFLSTLLLVAAVSLFLRLRHARGVERQQLKWFAYATTLLASGALFRYVIAEAMSVSWAWWVGIVLIIAGIVGIPIAVGIAILKYRLYDIDLIINRTLVYGALTASLALVYFGSVTLLQGLLHALTEYESQLERSQLAVVASTLAVAGLFGPLRRRVQAFIDRRFYRSKYDAGKTLEAFSARVRDEVDLEKLTGELVEVIDRTVQPAHVSLWLRPPQRESIKEQLL